MHTYKYYMKMAESMGGVNDPRIDVVWTKFELEEAAQEFYDKLKSEGVVFYREGVQSDNKVAWYKS